VKFNYDFKQGGFAQLLYTLRGEFLADIEDMPFVATRQTPRRNRFHDDAGVSRDLVLTGTASAHPSEAMMSIQRLKLTGAAILVSRGMRSCRRPRQLILIVRR
jgi:hypothetical protein